MFELFLPLQEAVIREVKEESGLDFHPLALVAVEGHGRHWLRFTFTGKAAWWMIVTSLVALFMSWYHCRRHCWWQVEDS